jgi:hypothetical protein
VAKRTLTMTFQAEGLRETLAAFNRLPKDANAELRDAAGRIVAWVARDAKAASSIDPQAAAVGQTVRVARDRVPAVQAGGSAKITSQGIPAWRLLFGSEFGMSGRSGWFSGPQYADSPGRQFHSTHRGRQGRWFFPTVERSASETARLWNDAADAIVHRWEANS